MILKNFVNFIFIFLIFSIENLYANRYNPDADIELENLEVKNCLNEIQVTLTMLTKQSFTNFKYEIEQLLDLVEAINEMGAAGANLARLMMDDSSNCGNFFGRIEVETNETLATGLVIKPSDVNIEYTGQVFRIQDLQTAIRAMTNSTEQAKEIVITLLTTNNKRAADDIKMIVEAKSTQEKVTNLPDDAPLSEEAMKKLLEDVMKTLRQMEHELKTKIEQSQDLSREAQLIHSDYNHNIVLAEGTIEGNEFSCQIDFDMENKKIMNYYSYTDITENIGILRGIEKDILDRLNHSSNLSAQLLRQSSDVLKVIKEKIDFLIELNKRLYNRQQELLQAYMKALEEKKVDRAIEYLTMLKDLHNVKKATRTLYKAKDMNYEVTLKQCYTFQEFSSKVGCMNVLCTELANKSENILLKLVLDEYLDVVKLKYKGEGFSNEAALYVAHIYISNGKVGLKVLQQFYKYIEKLIFIMRDKSKWQVELLLFLESNMRLIMKETCAEHLFEPMKEASRIQTDVYFRFSIVAIEVLLAKLKDKNKDLFAMLIDLKHLLYAYWKNPKHLNEIQFCKDLKRTVLEQF